MTMKRRMLVVLAVILCCTGLMISLLLDAPTAADFRVMEFAREKGIPYSDYPDNILDLLDRNPETEEFVLNYPIHEETVVDLSGYDPASGIPLFLQWDRQWGYEEYGSGCVGITGSGPMCLAMVGWYLSGGDGKFSPDRIVDFALQNGYYVEKSGSKWSLITEGGAMLGLRATELPLVENKIAGYLHNGDPVIAVMASGDFSASGQYIVLTGYTDGMVSINDPNSKINSQKLWDYTSLAGQIRNLWVIQMV